MWWVHFKIFPFSYFEMYIIVNCSHLTVQGNNTRTCFSYNSNISPVNHSLPSLLPSSNLPLPFLPLPKLLVTIICSLLLWDQYSFHMQMRSCCICLSLPGLFHLIQCPPGLSMLLQMTGFHPFLWLNNTPLCICPRFSLTIHPLMILRLIPNCLSPFLLLLQNTWDWLIYKEKRTI